MGDLKKIKTAQEYYDNWYPLLSDSQAKTLETLKKACDQIEGLGPNSKLIPKRVGAYCQETLGAPPAEMTIRNMYIEVKGTKEHVFRDYLQKRNAEYSGKRTTNPAKGRAEKRGKASSAPSYLELANNIPDSDTRSWVRDLIQRWQQAENSCDYLSKQMEHMSKEANGFDMATAITQGPSEHDLSLPLMNGHQSEIVSVNISEDTVSAIKAILSIPGNQEVPFLELNSNGALVWDSGTGPVVLLTRKQWEALKKAVKGGE
jgi:hypothetical protein